MVAIKRSGQHCSQQVGFTLIEALIALALLALLGLASALALSSAMRAQETLDSHQQALDRLQRSQLLLRRDLEQTLARQGRDSLGNPVSNAFIAYPQADSSHQGLLLQLVKSGRRMLGRSTGSTRLEQVRYRLEEGQLLRQTTPLLDPSVDTAWHSTVLLDNLTELRLRFFHGDSWHDQWPPLGLTPSEGSTFITTLPAAIEVKLETERYQPIRQLILLPEQP